MKISLTVNGEVYQLEVPANRRLVDLLREDLNLRGTKYGCGEGECGACTVILNGKAVNSCLVLAADADGGQVTTIEGMAQDGRLHPLQEAFIREGAVQCGFCTPGTLMSAKALLDSCEKPSDDEIKNALEGNFCRCTGYNAIFRAVKSVVEGGEHRG